MGCYLLGDSYGNLLGFLRVDMLESTQTRLNLKRLQKSHESCCV